MEETLAKKLVDVLESPLGVVRAREVDDPRRTNLRRRSDTIEAEDIILMIQQLADHVLAQPAAAAGYDDFFRHDYNLRVSTQAHEVIRIFTS